MVDNVPLSLSQVHDLATEIFLAHGISADQTRALVDIITRAERDGCAAHGLFRVPAYVGSVDNGKISPDAVPSVEELAPGVLKVDANNGFAPLALEQGRAPLIEKTRTQGIAALVVCNSYHFAALWPEVESLAEAGLVAFAFVNSRSAVAPAGGVKPLYGTNPMAFGWPRPHGPPMVFDQASSACARGEMMIHQRDGKPIPLGWAIDAHGEPTTDAAAGLAGAQLPFGGHKGAAVALMVELLVGALSGGVFGFEKAAAPENKDGGPTIGSELIIALNPAACVDAAQGEGQLARAEALFAQILAQEGTRLPSQRRHLMRERTPVEGVSIPRSLYDTLQTLRGNGG